MDKCWCVVDMTDIRHPRIFFCPLHKHAGELRDLVDDMDYVLTNVWAPDYKGFHNKFSKRIKELLAKTQGGKDEPK